MSQAARLSVRGCGRQRRTTKENRSGPAVRTRAAGQCPNVRTRMDSDWEASCESKVDCEQEPVDVLTYTEVGCD